MSHGTETPTGPHFNTTIYIAVATIATHRHCSHSSTPSLGTNRSSPPSNLPTHTHAEAEFALCLIGRKWCEVKHFDPKGTQGTKESMWKGEMPRTARHTRFQRGCRKCTAQHSNRCKKSKAKTKRKKAGPK